MTDQQEPQVTIHYGKHRRTKELWGGREKEYYIDDIQVSEEEYYKVIDD